MNREEKIREMSSKLPTSEVFPEYIREMLLRNLQGLAEKQLDLLFEILEEERKRLAEIH
ncbi:MAG: hypothetical protein PHV42_04500 [Candidatus Pacebacteria bacterium]|nr:hypothetical protein [Candidatus Paceibacterota bacterium]